MSVWRLNDWRVEEPEEDKSWELTEADTDDEFDDIALARLGVSLPDCARNAAVFAEEEEDICPDCGSHYDNCVCYMDDYDESDYCDYCGEFYHECRC